MREERVCTFAFKEERPVVLVDYDHLRFNHRRFL